MSPDDDRRKLDRIALLLHEPTTPAMLRISILALIEDSGIPEDRRTFLALAARAGVSQARRYEAWKQLYLSGHGGDDKERELYRMYSERATEPPEPPVPALAEMEIGEADLATAHYRLYDAARIFLYTGVADNLKARFDQHKRESPWWPEVARKTVTWYGSRIEALLAEDIAIKTERPVHNKAGAVSLLAGESAA
jgi:predicted GIY-YIG superfamily endonuclease